jgi:hypothetical protein
MLAPPAAAITATVPSTRAFLLKRNIARLLIVLSTTVEVNRG